jgi:ABC-type protease/lipase transport system fused ATPase/permease subunit
MSSNYEEIRANMQKSLASFLLAEIQSGMTAARSALVGKQLGRTDHVIETKRQVSKSAETVKKFLGQIKDRETRAALADQLAELERIIPNL